MSRAKSAPAPKPAKSAKAAKPAAATKRPAAAGRPGVFVQKPKSDIYVALLSVALAAILIGTLLLVLHLKAYDFETKATGLLPAGTFQSA